MLFYPYFCTNLRRFLHFEKGFFVHFFLVISRTPTLHAIPPRNYSRSILQLAPN